MFHEFTLSLRRIKPASLPPLTYGLSRDIELTWLAPFVYGLGIIALISLIILNIALTTYDAIVTTSDNYNATQTLWYHRFTGPPKPGSQCSSYNLTVGQQFTTTNNIWTYTLLTIEGGKRILPYTGIPLESCDVVSAAVDVDVTATTVTNIAYVACNSTDLKITAKAEYVWSRLPSLEDVGRTSPGQSFFPDSVPEVPNQFVGVAFNAVCGNLKALLQAILARRSKGAPGRISIQGVPSCTQHPYYSDLCSPYCRDDDTVPVTWVYGGGLESYFGSSNGTELPTQFETQNISRGLNWVNLALPYDFPNAQISGAYLPAITNILQLVISTVRLDYGRILPNNPFLNITAMNQTLQDPFPKDIQVTGIGSWSATLQPLIPQINDTDYESFIRSNITYINGEYQCRFWYPVGWAQGTVNVMVATLSLFTTGWGIAMLVIAFLVNRTVEDNFCMGHAAVMNRRAAKSRQPHDIEKVGSSTGSEEGSA